MTDRAPGRLAGAVVLLAAFAAGVLVLRARREAADTERSAAFQRTVGGLGTGGATSLVPCEAAFDDGVAGACVRELDPAAGGRAFCTHHSGPALGR